MSEVPLYRADRALKVAELLDRLRAILHLPVARSEEPEQLLRRNVKRFRGGLVFKAHRLYITQR